MALRSPLAFSLPRRGAIERRTSTIGLAVLLACCAPGAFAQAHADGFGFYLQGGQSLQQDRDNQSMFIGVMLPRARQEPGGSISSYWELFGGRWRGQQAGGADRNFAQLGAALIWRRHFEDNRSAWFGEGGLGISMLDGDYALPDGRIFGSRFTFNGRLGVGRTFGARAEHELSLIYQHFSNGGIKTPNPGMDLLQLRYAYRF